jgi:hypothetical protein
MPVTDPEFAAGWRPPHPVAAEPVADLLQGAYDLHVHSGPDRRPRRYDALDLARRYAEAGLAGAVIKDHFLPTVGRAHVLNRILPDFRCLATCVLNASVGGLNPAAVEASLDAGVRVFIMPTVSAAYYRRYEARHGGSDPGGPHLAVLDDDDRLGRPVLDVLAVLAGHDVVLASGHLGPRETLALFREAHRRGLRRLVVTHASIDFLRMPMDVQRDIARLGGMIEHAYVSCLFSRPVELAEMWWQIKELGVGSCYLASDLGQLHHPPPLDGWRAALGGLLALGATRQELRDLAVHNPAEFVAGIPRFAGAWIPQGWHPEAGAEE